MVNVNIPSVIGVDYTAVYAATDIAPWELGTQIETEDGLFEFAEVDEAAGIAAGAFAIIGPTGLAIAMNTTDSGSLGQKIGVANVTLADNERGWFWRGVGSFEAFVTNGVAADTQLTTTGSDGIAGTGGDAIQGLRNLDLGVTSTRVTVFAATVMTTNV